MTLEEAKSIRDEYNSAVLGMYELMNALEPLRDKDEEHLSVESISDLLDEDLEEMFNERANT